MYRNPSSYEIIEFLPANIYNHKGSNHAKIDNTFQASSIWEMEQKSIKTNTLTW